MESSKTYKSILDLARKEGMPFAFRFCRDDKKFGQILFSDVKYLKSIIIVGMGENYVKTRKDLKTVADWTNYCQGISNGFSFNFAVAAVGEEPLKVMSAHDFPPDVKRISFNIDGLQPSSSETGFIFIATSIRSQSDVPEFMSEEKLVVVSKYKNDFIISWMVNSIITMSAERGQVTAFTIQDGSSLNVQEQHFGKSVEDLTSALTRSFTSSNFELLFNTATITFITKTSETWLFVIKKKEIVF